MSYKCLFKMKEGHCYLDMRYEECDIPKKIPLEAKVILQIVAMQFLRKRYLNIFPLLFYGKI